MHAKIIRIMLIILGVVALGALLIPGGNASGKTKAEKAPYIVGTWNEYAVQLSGGEKGLHEHFQPQFAPDGNLISVSATPGDGAVVGTWEQPGEYNFVAQFDSLNQNTKEPFDHVHVLLLGKAFANTFRAFGFETLYTASGKIVGHGSFKARGIRIPPVSFPDNASGRFKF